MNQKLQDVAEQNEIDFNGVYGFSVNNKAVRDFVDYIRFYSGEKLDEFTDRAAIFSLKDEILHAVELDLLRDKTREEMRLSADRDTAEYNLKNFVKIINALCNYYEAEIKHQ